MQLFQFRVKMEPCAWFVQKVSVLFVIIEDQKLCMQWVWAPKCPWILTGGFKFKLPRVWIVSEHIFSTTNSKENILWTGKKPTHQNRPFYPLAPGEMLAVLPSPVLLTLRSYLHCLCGLYLILLWHSKTTHEQVKFLVTGNKNIWSK